MASTSAVIAQVKIMQLQGHSAEQSAEAFHSFMESLGKGSLELFNRLPPAGREYFRRGVEQRLRGQPGSAATIEALYSVDYTRIPPTPKVFLDSTDYVKHVSCDLFSAWRPHFLSVCDPASRVYEANVTGASGNGKTTWAMLVLSYLLCRLGHLRDPAKFYGLQARSKIVFGLYALTKDMIKEVGFDYLSEQVINGSPFFNDVMRRSPFGKEKIEWPDQRIEVITGSSALHAVGKNLFAVVADELNFFSKGEKTATRAHELVSEVSTRLEGRFISSGGDIPGIAIYISQTRTTSDYLELRIRNRKPNHRGVMVIRGPRWRFNENAYARIASKCLAEPKLLGEYPVDTVCGKVPGFRILVGDEVTDARVLDGVAQREDGSYHVQAVDPDLPVPDGRIIHVPALHFRSFEQDLYGSLRSIADEPTGSFTPFFSRKEVTEGRFDEDLVFPFTSQSVPVYERQSHRLRDFFRHELVTRVNMGRRVPIRHPEAPRYIHLDLSKGGDRTGFVMVHPSQHYQAFRSHDELEDDSSQVGETEVLKDIEVDFYLAITGGPFKEAIDYRKIRVFINFLRSLGYWIQWVTADQYMSADHNMRLRDAGFNSELLSTDRTSKPYRACRQLFNEGRIALPFPPGLTPSRWGSRKTALEKVILFQELSGLEHDVKRDKVDHRDQNPDGSRGSKDVADGLAGSIFRCLVDDVRPGGNPQNPSHRRRAEDKLNRYLQVGPHFGPHLQTGV